MPRSLKKGPVVVKHIIKSLEEIKSSGKNFTQIKTYARKATVLPDFVGITFLVHNGKNFIPVLITEGMVGHKLGEFSPTRTFKGHKNSKA